MPILGLSAFLSRRSSILLHSSLSPPAQIINQLMIACLSVHRNLHYEIKTGMIEIIFLICFSVPARIVNISKNVSVNEGENVNLYCLAVGRPEPTVIWKDQKCKLPLLLLLVFTSRNLLFSASPLSPRLHIHP